MRKMSRIVSLVLSIMLLATLCGNAIAEEKTIVTIWQRASGPSGAMQAWIENFNASQDEIEVVYEPYGENYNNILNMALNNESGPDIFEISSSGAPVCDFAKAGHAAALDDLLTEEYKADFVADTFTMKSFQYEGKIYGVPTRLQHYKLLYNKDLFEQNGLTPPTTLEEMRECARIITENGNGEVYGFGLYGNYGACWFRHVDMINIARGVSGAYGFDYATGKFDFSTQEKVLNFWVDMANDGSLLPGGMSMGVEQMRAYFAAGMVGMIIDGGWMSKIFATSIECEANWDAVEIPIFEGETRAKDYLYCDTVFAVNAHSEHLEAAKVVYKSYLDSQYETRAFGDSDTKTYIPANTDECLATLPNDQFKFQGLPETNNIANNACFKVEPHRHISLEGDSRDAVLNKLFTDAMDGVSNDWAAAFADLDVRYNAAVDKALENGDLVLEDIKIDGFDYFTR